MRRSAIGLGFGKVGSMVAWVVLLVGSAGLAEPRYEFIDLGTLGGRLSRAQALNDQGMVVGESMTEAEEIHAFIWTATEGMRRIEGAQLVRSKALQIGPRGLVRCSELDLPAVPPTPIPGQPRGRPSGGLPPYGIKSTSFLWTESQGRIDLKLPGTGVRLVPERITHSGLILCNEEGNRRVSPSVLLDSSFEIADFNIDLGTGVLIHDVNSRGMVWGIRGWRSPLAKRVPGQGFSPGQEFLYDGQTVHDLIPATTTEAFRFTDLNERGELVGRLRREFGLPYNLPILWSATDTLVQLPVPRNFGGAAERLNNRGQVVGYADRITLRDRVEEEGIYNEIIVNLAEKFSSAQEEIAVLWENGKVQDLNRLVELPAGWESLKSARDINDLGWIVGTGTKNGEDRGFLLKPLDSEGPRR